jgi:hypothetical protein
VFERDAVALANAVEYFEAAIECAN